MKPAGQIETERLVLRKPRPDDASAMFDGWTTDPEVTRYLTWRPHQNLEQTGAFLSGCISAWNGDARFPFMICLKGTAEITGMIDPRIEDHRVMVGYVAARACWGRGYMTEALRAIIRWAFQQPGIYRVYATTDLENIGSRRVMEKAGMSCEGILRKYMVHPNISEVPRDCYICAIVK